MLLSQNRFWELLSLRDRYLLWGSIYLTAIPESNLHAITKVTLSKFFSSSASSDWLFKARLVIARWGSTCGAASGGGGAGVDGHLKTAICFCHEIDSANFSFSEIDIFSGVVYIFRLSQNRIYTLLPTRVTLNNHFLFFWMRCLI